MVIQTLDSLIGALLNWATVRAGVPCEAVPETNFSATVEMRCGAEARAGPVRSVLQTRPCHYLIVSPRLSCLLVSVLESGLT